MQWWETFKHWFFSLGENYGVNPYIFGGIYIGAIPFFFLCLGWTIKNIKQKKSFVLPLLLTGLFFISAYVYLLIAGKNIPVVGVHFYSSNDSLWCVFNHSKGKSKNK